MGIGLTLQQVEGWQGQYETMLRWRRRVVEAANGERFADELDCLLTFSGSGFAFAVDLSGGTCYS
jgi:hypothetical protein